MLDPRSMYCGFTYIYILNNLRLKFKIIFYIYIMHSIYSRHQCINIMYVDSAFTLTI